MLMILFDLLLSAYQGSILIYTLKKQFVQRPHSFLYEVFSVLLIVLYIVAIQYFQLPLSDSLMFLIPLIYIRLTSRSSFLTCALWVILDGFLFMGTLTLVSSLFEIQIGINGSVLSASPETLMIYNFVGNAALTVVLNVAARINKVKSIIAKTEMLLFLIMLLLCFIINECFFTARLSEMNQNPLLIGAICSFVLMILTMVLYERMTSAAQKQKQSELAAQTAQLISEHQDELKSIYKKMLAEQHDLRHRVAAAEELLSAGTFSENQMQHIRGLLINRQEALTFLTGNMAVDAILKAKYAVMDNVGITFEFVEYPLEPLPIPEQDFCMLLGNLLDNAIEGVMRLPASAPSRQIRLAFSKVWDMLFITCENDADIGKICRQGETFLSTKDQPVLHGFGTENMKQIVRKAGGTIEFETAHNQFTVQIMLGGSSAVDKDGTTIDNSTVRLAMSDCQHIPHDLLHPAEKEQVIQQQFG